MLKPGRELQGRITREWEEIGFQGQDPATDFRGAGIFGLHQLLRLCQNADNLVRKLDTVREMFAQSEYQAANKSKSWYFFAVTGLNISSKLLMSLRKGVFDSSLLNVMEGERGFDPEALLLEVFDVWYFNVFKAFNDKWLAEGKTMMEFTQFFDRLYETEFLNNHHKYLQEYIDILVEHKSTAKATVDSSAITSSQNDLLAM